MSGDVRYINEQGRRRDAEYDRHAQWRSIADTVNEAKGEFKQFAETRFAMLQAEMKEKLQAIKASAPMMVMGSVLGLTAFLLFTGALVSLIWIAFRGNAYGPFLAFVIVGVIYGVVGAIAFLVGYGRIKNKGLVPERTIKVLKEDKEWLQNEARTQL